MLESGIYRPRIRFSLLRPDENGNGTVNIVLVGETSVIPNLKNKTNQTVIAND